MSGVAQTTQLIAHTDPKLWRVVKIIEKTVVRNHINLNQLVTDILAYPIETLRVE